MTARRATAWLHGHGHKHRAQPRLRCDVWKLNMWPFCDVYGIVAPLRSTAGSVATSRS